MPSDQNDEGGQTPKDLRDYADRVKAENDALRADVAAGQQAARELAFIKAGVDTESPVGELFVKAYSGELEPEAIKSSWVKLVPEPTTTEPPAGGETPPAAETPPAEGLTPEQLAAMRNDAANLNANSTPPGQEPKTPVGRAAMDAAFEAQGGVRARPSTGMGDKAANAALSVMFGRAAEGDPDAVFKAPNESWADATDRWRANQ